MSRVVYDTTPVTADQEALRASHGVRLVSQAEEGSSVGALPGGVFGFTYSPGTPAAPLFATRRYRSFETHKLKDGGVSLLGYTSADVARQLATATEDVTIQLQPHPEDGQDALVEISYSRIRQHRQYAAPNQHGFTATVMPAGQAHA